MFEPVEVRAGSHYHLFVRYADGVSGEVDLSHLAGKGVFAAWMDEAFFRDVRIGEHGRIMWSDAIDLCPDAIYMQITGLTVDQAMAKVDEVQSHA